VAKLVSFIIFLLNLDILKFLNYRKLPVIFMKKTGNGGQKNGRYTGATGVGIYRCINTTGERTSQNWPNLAQNNPS
jgi:hypothetical protein